MCSQDTLPISVRSREFFNGAAGFLQCFILPMKETSALARPGRQLMLTHAESRLKPLAHPFLASAANTGTRKRSHSYSGYVLYHVRLTLENLGNEAHNGHRASPRYAVAASSSVDAGCPPQFCPDTDSETETYVWTQSSRGTLSGVAPPVWNLPLPARWCNWKGTLDEVRHL